MRISWLEPAWITVTQNCYCNLSQGSSSSFPASRSMHSWRGPISWLHECNPAKTSAAAASSPILRAALSRSFAEGWVEMSILRQSEQPSNSPQEVSQSVGRGFRGQPDHVVFYLSSESTLRFSVRFAKRRGFYTALHDLRFADLRPVTNSSRRSNFA